MGSRTHRAVILGAFTIGGVGIAVEGNGAAWITLDVTA
jgi:hypothetical protein